MGHILWVEPVFKEVIAIIVPPFILIRSTIGLISFVCPE